MSCNSAFEILSGDPACGLILLADHATNRLPSDYGSLGLPPEAFERHIAYDIGVEALTRSLSARLGAPAAMSCFSRLLIDPNRGEDDPTLIMRISDGAIIPANHPLPAEEQRRRIERFHRPYHQAVSDLIADTERATGRTALVLSLHSYTPHWKGVARPWHAAVLWDSDPRAAMRLISALRDIDGVLVGDNEPYDGALRGDTMHRHCTEKGRPHALLEIRQDEIGAADGISLWSDRLAPIFAALNGEPDLHRTEIFPSRTDRIWG
ncbi:N-formylglutamate amidohydrolase [Rhizobium sp. SG_E_25_P2]|uniref:N-formylglutamate amidohydrolase n=1 Tax=Rhizobium sp. SG_E_25_P2 TaxID=2879942 RepID=UPI002476EB76|nr:N-formylglutamate amidohydrolase [Rhizobium sp. SG_E_25_P2]